MVLNWVIPIVFVWQQEWHDLESEKEQHSAWISVGWSTCWQNVTEQGSILLNFLITCLTPVIKNKHQQTSMDIMW